MAAGLREMQENRGFSENRIDKIEFEIPEIIGVYR